MIDWTTPVYVPGQEIVRDPFNPDALRERAESLLRIADRMDLDEQQQRQKQKHPCAGLPCGPASPDIWNDRDIVRPSQTVRAVAIMLRALAARIDNAAAAQTHSAACVLANGRGCTRDCPNYDPEFDDNVGE